MSRDRQEALEGGSREGQGRGVNQGMALQCHPLVNTATLALARSALERFLAVTGHNPRVLEVPGRSG